MMSSIYHGCIKCWLYSRWKRPVSPSCQWSPVTRILLSVLLSRALVSQPDSFSAQSRVLRSDSCVHVFLGITPPSQLATPSPVSTTVPQTPVSVSAATQPPVSTGTQRASESMSPSAALFVVNSLWVVVGCATLDMMIR